MPPKKLKDISNAPVYQMGHEQQVQLLSDALLREYMHRRGYLATLKAFDAEHPRDADTISSRALMSDLMDLSGEAQQRMKADGIETIMEMLCNLRVERRLETNELVRAAQVAVPPVPENYESLKAKQEKRLRRKEEKSEQKKSKDKKKSSSKRQHSRGDSQGNDSAAGQRGKASGPGFTMDDLIGSSGESSDEAASPEAEHRLARAEPTAQPASGSGSGGTEAKNTVPRKKGRVSFSLTPQYLGSNPTSSASEEEEEAEEEEGESDDDAAATTTDSEAGNGALLDAGDREQLKAVFSLLCGNDGVLPRSYLGQGFVFDDVLQCALIQWSHGCGVVMAPVQAFVAAYNYEREVYVDDLVRKHDCLTKALCTIIEQAQPNAHRVVLYNGVWRCDSNKPHCTMNNFLKQCSSSHIRRWNSFDSMDEVRDFLGTTLLTNTQWMKPRGGGLLNFLLSVLVSHGVGPLQKELTTYLVEEHELLSQPSGEGRLPLLNLLLTGKPTKYRHNGVVDGNKVGFMNVVKCGLLCGDGRASGSFSLSLASGSGDLFGGHDNDIESDVAVRYTNATDPYYPSWVIYHKDHYSNLFMRKDTRPTFQQKVDLGGSASVDVVYWDAVTEDDEFVLTLTTRNNTWGQGDRQIRNANSFVNTAITSVPSWSSVLIDWHNVVPLRD